MTNPDYDYEYNPPTQEMNPQTAYGSGLSREAYNSQRAYANTPDADYYTIPQTVRRESSPRTEAPRKKPASGLATRFDVNKLSVDIVVNSVITGIVSTIVAIIAELVLASFLPSDWPMKQFGIPFWCAAGFAIIMFLVAGGFIRAALDGQSNSDSLYYSLVWAFVLLAFLLFFLSIGIDWALITIAAAFIPMVITFLRAPSIVDNNRVVPDNDTEK